MNFGRKGQRRTGIRVGSPCYRQAWQGNYGDHWSKEETITRRTTELLNLVDLHDRIKHSLTRTEIATNP